MAAPLATKPRAPTDGDAAGATVSSERHDPWQRDYTRARNELTAGHFALAAEQFRALAASATNPFDRRLALEQAALASDWQTRNLVLALRSEQDSKLPPVASNRRTTDEISILYTNAAIYGLGSGAALAINTEPDSAAGGILPALGLAGAAIGAVALVDVSSHELRYGVPQSIVSGMYIGLEEAFTWVIWNQARSYWEDEWEPATVATLIWGGATLGAAVGGVVGSLRGTTPGRASFVGSTSLWTGAVAGLTAGALSSDEETRDDGAMLSAALGVNAGAVGGMFLAGPISPSIARVRFLDLGAVGGSLVFGGLYWAIADDEVKERAFMGSMAAGLAVGLGTAWFATRNMAPDLGPSAANQTSLLSSLRPTVAPAPGGALLALHGSL
ncbi:MAG: hypothetical protein ACOY0T_11410 [Myxococcota bacterium]